MNVERFYTLVEECLGGGCHAGMLAADEAAITTHIVLGAIGRLLDHGDRLHLAQSLPRRLAVDLVSAPDHAFRDVVAHVASELQVDREIAARRIHCVIEALREAAGAALPDALASLTP